MVIGQGRFSQIKLDPPLPHWVRVGSESHAERSQETPNILRTQHHEEPGSSQGHSVISGHWNPEKYYIMMEYPHGEQLFDHVPLGGMQEEEAWRFFQQEVCAMDYCHDKGIMHWDLKSENCMADVRGNIKFIDFGLSARFTSGQNVSEFWGILSHLAPEMVLQQEHKPPYPPSNIWSLGIILYILLWGDTHLWSLPLRSWWGRSCSEHTTPFTMFPWKHEGLSHNFWPWAPGSGPQPSKSFNTYDWHRVSSIYPIFVLSHLPNTQIQK